MADARLGLGPLPPAPPRYERVNEQAFRQQMDSLRRSVEQYVASSRNTLEAELTAHGISDLADVEITSVASGEVLAFDGDDWINQTLAEAGIAAASHTHVEADITDLDHYDDADADARIALATLADLASADASELDAGVLADARVQESNVTQHQGALSLTESQISDLAHFSGDAADLTGTLADARLSANVPLKDAANVFTAQQKVDGIENGLLIENDGDGDFCFIAINSGDQPNSERAGFNLQHGGITRYQFVSQNHPSADAIFQVRQFDDTGSDIGGFVSFRQDLNRLFLGAGNNGVQVGASSSNVAFYGTTPIAKPTVTGSRGGNAALASLLTQLANLGLITNSTT